ncbi:MAG: thioredoxin family protein [Chloroflexi bacterium]|nr:MAG: thioredoxin family protein [Chloroflexota bacterium]
MLILKVLGSGCKNCELLAQRAGEALELLAEERDEDLDAVIQKVTDVQEFARYGVMFTPALVVNEKVVSSGKIPAVSQIKQWLADALVTA